jgi:hypothetical protein
MEIDDLGPRPMFTICMLPHAMHHGDHQLQPQAIRAHDNPFKDLKHQRVEHPHFNK